MIRLKIKHRREAEKTRDDQTGSKETKGVTVTLADQPDSAASLNPIFTSSSSATTTKESNPTPALRRSSRISAAKMSTNTRTTRSRFSSPQVGGTQGSKGANTEESQKTFMQRWLEPPVQIKASYQEAGLMRGPIFENMAPLGTLPKVGLFKKTAVPSPAPTSTATTPDDSSRTPFRRRIVIKGRQSAAAPQTPTPAPPPPPPPPAAAEEQDETEPDETEEEDNDDQRTEEQEDDEDGGAGIVDSEVLEVSSSMMSAGRRTRRAVSAVDTDDEDYAPGRGGRAGSIASRTRRSASRASTRSQPSASTTSLKEVVGKVVEVSVSEALANYRYPTAWALRTLFDENSHDKDFLVLMHRVFTQTANADEFEDFGRRVVAKKREGKKNNTALRHFLPDAKEPPHPPKRAPYGNLVKFDVSALRLERKSRGGAAAAAASKGTKRTRQSTAAAAANTTAATTSNDEAAAASSSSSSSTSASGSGRSGSSAPATTGAASTEPTDEKDAEAEAELPPRKKRKSTRHQSEAVAASSSTSAKGKMPAAVAKTNGASSTTATSNKSNGNGNGNGSKAIVPETPSRRRTRARSTSSSISSLSSALSLTPPGTSQEQQDKEDNRRRVDETPSRDSPAPPTAAAAPEPITANKRRRVNAPRKARNANTKQHHQTLSSRQQSPAAASSTTTATTATTAPAPSAAQQLLQDEEEQPYAMPAVVDTPLVPFSDNSKKGAKGAASLGIVFPAKFSDKTEEPSELELKRRAYTAEARKHTASALDIPMSSARDEPLTPAPAREKEKRGKKGASSSSTTPAAATTTSLRPRPPTPMTAPATRPRPQVVAQTAPASERPTPAREGRSTRSSLKRSHDESEEQQPQQPSSPAFANFPGSDAAPSTAANSRAGTPALRAPKRTRTGLRVKTSPMKKKNGPSAGIPRASGERSSPVGNARGEDDNDDYCSSCGGNGELLCCDGCTRSFHFSCVDPPIQNPGVSDMPEEWFCNVCRARRDPAHLPVRTGAFGMLLEKLDTRNASAFRLPASVRERFEGVRTGPDGEYEEVTQPVKPTRKKKADEELGPDFFTRLRDADGNPVICHGCQRGSSADRALIIPCSSCGLHWHLDCLDPPMAQPPVLRTWKCPLHTDELLSKLPAQLAPAHRFRKIKDAPVIRPVFTRGYANNGYIDVDFDDTPDESGWRDIESFGRVVRLSEKGIKLDFLSRLREQRQAAAAAAAAAAKQAETPKPAIEPAPAPLPAQPLRTLDQVSLEEQQVALTLTSLAQQRDEGVSVLIDTLVKEADPAVLNIMSRADASRVAAGQLNRMDQQGLRAILAKAESLTEQIRKLLGEASSSSADGEVAGSSETKVENAGTGGDVEMGENDRMDTSEDTVVVAADPQPQQNNTTTPAATTGRVEKSSSPDTIMVDAPTTTTTNKTKPGSTTATTTPTKNKSPAAAAASPVTTTDDHPATITQGEAEPEENEDDAAASPTAQHPPALAPDHGAAQGPADSGEIVSTSGGVVGGDAGDTGDDDVPTTPTKATGGLKEGGSVEPVVVDEDGTTGGGEGEVMPEEGVKS
ncbi:hypothetical protein VTJ04DRAFT_3768 [Mycothermus thermophilus]|uniref:uncharacterized protein n=1 Tax=Humicola insolens TaxID=85995 RepID=UPI0037433B75